MIQSNVLLSQMKLKNISTKSLADAQGWSKATTYRKINGKADFTHSEIQVLVRLLDLDASLASTIFFASDLSLRQNEGVVDGD